MTMQPDILAVYPSVYFDSTPCVRNLVTSLAESGRRVHLVTFAPPAGPLPRGVTAEVLNGIGGTFRTARALRHLAHDWTGPPRALLAIDRGGLLALTSMREWRQAPLVYSSTEIFIPPVFNHPSHRVANALERMACRRARLVISPSRERMRLHCRLYGVKSQSALPLPNSPRGNAQWAPRTNTLAERLGIDPRRRIILAMGSLTGPNRIGELLAGASAWPKEWALVLHSREELPGKERRRFQKAGRNVFLSAQPLGPDDLVALCQGADVGVALYREDGPTFQTVGTAAGKVAQYLFAGLPVITTPVKSLASLFEQSGGGMTAEPGDGSMARAITAILEGGENQRRRAALCFEKHFSFDRAWSRTEVRILHALTPESDSQ